MVQLIGEDNGSPKSVDQIRVKWSEHLLMEKIMKKSHLEGYLCDKLKIIIKRIYHNSMKFDEHQRKLIIIAYA